MSSFCICKSYSHFFSKNTCELNIVLSRTVNILTTNELVKLMMFWTTGPWWTCIFEPNPVFVPSPSSETDNCPSWISRRERMNVENISWSVSMKECCWTHCMRDQICHLLFTCQMLTQLSHQGWLYLLKLNIKIYGWVAIYQIVQTLIWIYLFSQEGLSTYLR